MVQNYTPPNLLIFVLQIKRILESDPDNKLPKKNKKNKIKKNKK